MTSPSATSLTGVPDLPFKYVGGDPALDLVNTVDWTDRGLENDRLNDFDRLTRWAEGARIISAKAAASLRATGLTRPQEADAAYRRALQVRAVLRRLFSEVARHEPATASLDRFNQQLGAALRQMRVAPTGQRRRGDQPMRLAWGDPEKHLESLLWPVVWSAVSLLVSEDAARIRICGGADCGWMYVDRSRNRLRRWCQMETCGTREKSRRRYQRMREG